MEFTGFCPQGLDLLVENQMMNSPVFYEEHKAQIKELAIRPFYDLCESVKTDMLAIDPAFVVIPSRMISRVRRDTRYTKDKTLYRSNLWIYFRRPRAQFEDVPFYYMEIGPEFWRYGCWGGFGRGEMEQARHLIVKEDIRFQAAYKAVQEIEGMELAGALYKRPKCPQAAAQYQPWLNRKQLGVDFTETEDFSPAFDGSFVPEMIERFHRLKPFYDFLCTIREQAKKERGDIREICCNGL
ncbi:MAG: DUF2461 family protein [Butyricicoccus pullicaecorum]|nr:DUF2461 domain-containing protein [Butyricicoccus pullicaecorum]MDO4668632.1 DUF2461 family protein [Butyricicoccus pullicaecorum]